MRYFLGMDAGGTKTHCYIGDENGNVLGEGFGGAGNYQTCGAKTARESYGTAIREALKAAEITLDDICYGVFGLSGADEQIDFDILEPMCKELMNDVPHVVLNDTWIGLRTGAPFGVVSICGTGAAHAGKDRNGNSLILRNLYYETGNKGGGNDVVSNALHYAFRSDEGTYIRTALEEAIADIFNVKTMGEVAAVIRDNDEEVDRKYAFHIPIATMKLATEGDEVSRMIISEMGREEGRYAAGIIRRLGMESEEVPLVLIGSMFATGNPLLIEPYLEEARKAAPNAFIIIPDDKPVTGALQLAIDYGITLEAQTV